MRCTPVSEACDNCWHLRTCDRLSKNPKLPEYKRNVYAGTADYGFLLGSTEDLEAPLRVKKPSVIGVQFMGDLFHEDLPFAWVDEVFGVMDRAKQHTFVVLTKRSGRMRQYFSEGEPGCFPLSNVIGMVTVENQVRADERISDILACPLALRGVSVEPMLGPMQIWKYLTLAHADDIDGLDYGEYGPWRDGINWVVCGGETGPGARPMHPEWVRSLRDQCQAVGTKFFFKQWGEFINKAHVDIWTPPKQKSKAVLMGHSTVVWRVGSKAAGRLLDSQIWDQMPEIVHRG
jgi:protein gp37